MACFLGLDCGGTSTRALIIDASGQTIFEGTSGPANWASTSRDQLKDHLKQALAGAPTPDAVCGCMAGILTPEDVAEASALLAEVSGCALAEAKPDFHAALAACGPEATCCVISGTGSLVFSTVPGDQPQVVKSGGGGPLLGDQGSSFAIARDALSTAFFGSAVVASVSEAFMAKVEELFGTRDASAVPAKIYSLPSPAAVVAKLTPTIAADYAAGVAYAKVVIEDEMKRLAYLVHSHLVAYHSDARPWTIYLSGGLWDIHPCFKELFIDSMRVMAGGKDAKIEKLTISPVLGAAYLAREMKK